MDPQQNIVNPNTAMQPPVEASQAQVPVQANEVMPAVAPAEQQAAPVEVAPVPGQAAAPPVAQVPAGQAPVVAPTSQAVHVGSAQARSLNDPSLQNLQAGDEDLIEKEWVDKAEEVINTDQDNPRTEDIHQHELSKTYLKKRFNLDVS
jgi:hypothetical protein